MLANLHTHTTFCDGKNTPEEIVKYAIEKGFKSLGFSEHGYAFYDEGYCMTDTEGYIAEIKRVKEKYENDIQVYLGVEEDSYCLCNREDFEYIIGSCHFFLANGEYISVDSELDDLKRCIELCDNDAMKFADLYYSRFCEYLKMRKPDIIGHFDIITKYDELSECIFMNKDEYKKIAMMYTEEALKIGSIFEVNSGAVPRGLRKTPYPSMDILHTIKKNDGKITISSDSHSIDTLDCCFDEIKEMLREVGFKYIYVMYNNEFVKDYI